jgi:hypothetical protein
MRDTPPDIQQGEFGFEPDGVSNFDLDQAERGKLSSDDARNIAREAFEASTNWLMSSRRGIWADSLRAFNGRHPQGSKYLSREYAGRSSLYRPMTRTMVQKGMAATAQAFFSNEDVVSIKADNDDDPKQQASAEIMQALVQYRLEQTIPWFQTLVGARQDAEVLGICVGKAYWKYEERFLKTKTRPKLDDVHQMPMFDENNEPQTEDYDEHEILKDQPVIDLISPENIRYDPGADWRDPVNTSPYIIELIPMYHQDVRGKIDSGEWNDVGSSALGRSSADDSTRAAREPGRIPGVDVGDNPEAFDICWVRANIVKYDGDDWYFITIHGTGELLTDPVLLSEVHLHGQRPYVVGTIVVETHKNYPSSKVELVKDLQRIANDDLNLRFDAVKMSLNPRQFVKAGAGVELNDLRTMVPGKVIVVKGEKGEPPSSVMSWDRPPEPGQSSYMEQQLNTADWDGLTGSFNPGAQPGPAQQSATGMHLLSGEASGISEFELRIFTETFVQPILNLLIKLEQAYETNDVILATAANKAGLLQRFGSNEVTDELLNGSVTTRVNVGIGATNPAMRLRAFQQAAQILETILASPVAAQGLVFEEVVKEVFSGAGYKDGMRFIKPGFDPAQAMQAMEQAKQQGQGGDQGQSDQIKLQAAQIAADAKIKEATMRDNTERAKLAADQQRSQDDQSNENWRMKYKEDSANFAQGVPQQAEAINNAVSQVMPALHAQNQHNVQTSQVLADHQNALQQMHANHQQMAQNHANLAQQVAQSHLATHRHLSELAAHVSAPREIVRGPDGKVTGARIVPPAPTNF